MDIYSELEKRILVLDGAMGTMIQTYHLSEEDYRGTQFRDCIIPQKGNHDLLSITQASIIQDIHRAYLEAGSDIISTNSFNSNRISQTKYGLQEEVYTLNYESARLARALADEYTQLNPHKPRWVVGSIGPTHKSASLSPDVHDPTKRSVSFEDLRIAYLEQARALITGGAHLLLVETAFDTLNAKAALFAIEELSEELGTDIPIMLSATISKQSGRTISGQSLEAFVTSVSHARLLSLGLNCSFGAENLLPHVAKLGQISPFYISAHPNAGLPNAQGQYEGTPTIMGQQIAQYISSGLINIIGGCCGTTPAHIAVYSRLVQGAKPHERANSPTSDLVLSGREVLRLPSAQGILEVINKPDERSQRFQTLVEEKQYNEALSVAQEQVRHGAQMLNIRIDCEGEDAEQEMSHLVILLTSDSITAQVPLILSSPYWNVIEAGLRCTQGKSIVNALTLHQSEQQFKYQAQLAHRYGSAVIITRGKQGQSDTNTNDTNELTQRAYALLLEVGFKSEDIILS